MCLSTNTHAPKVSGQRLSQGESISLKTIFDHKERILRALKYIEKHINGSLKLRDLAEVACLSDYHFHRSFSYYIGDTVMGYVRKRRLAEAAKILRRSVTRITDVAFSIGYETVEAFTKAFKRRYGVSPSVFQRYHRDISNASRRPVSAVLLRPFEGIETRPSSGRESFWELSRMAWQIQLQHVATTWISVFPDVQTITRFDENKKAPPCIRLGRLKYKLIFPDYCAELHSVHSGECTVLHYDDEIIVFREAEKIMPPTRSHSPQHLARLPIRLRSILCTPN